MKHAILSFLFFPMFVLTSCTNSFDPTFDPISGCLLQKIELQDERFKGQAGYVGYCTDKRIIVRWENTTRFGLKMFYQMERFDDGRVVLSYKDPNGTWIKYSEKGGLEIEVPTDFQNGIK